MAVAQIVVAGVHRFRALLAMRVAPDGIGEGLVRVLVLIGGPCFAPLLRSLPL